jgi:hypothetical protein
VAQIVDETIRVKYLRLERPSVTSAHESGVGGSSLSIEITPRPISRHCHIHSHNLDAEPIDFIKDLKKFRHLT